MEDQQLANHIAFVVQKTLLLHGIQSNSNYVLKKISSALLEDEKISINWGASGVTVIDPERIIPIRISPETKRIDNFNSILDAYTKQRSDGSDKLLILETANNFLNKEVDTDGTITMDIGEVKAFGFMLVEIYKKFCI